ncbi:signal transduction histidine kinase/DNA-binding response OmpR family regulator [Pedobacter sp. CG_S7]|uniref:response regulator n=1 Tax=Pedobacter sp. CG_S7 TaxID=3143930 RepID=UPI00339144C3
MAPYKHSSFAYLQKLMTICLLIFVCQQCAKAQHKKDSLLEARSLLKQSSVAYKAGDEISALKYARQALKLSSITDSNTYAKSSIMVAYMLSRQGQDVEALNVAFKILRETEARGWKKLSIGSMGCIADLYRSINNPQAALPYALRASKEALILKDSVQYIFTLSTLSNLYSHRNMESTANLVKASKYMEIILAPPYLRLLTDFDQSRYLSNLGRLYLKQDQLVKAEGVLMQSIAISRREKFLPLEKTVLNELMTLYIQKGQFREAIKYGEQALAIQPEAQTSRVLQKNIYLRLSEAYVGVKNFEQALMSSQKATQLNDSISTANKAKDAAELDKKYLNDKRLIIATSKTKLLEQQRNFIIILSVILAISSFAAYRVFNLRRKRKADMLLQEHLQLERLDALKTRFFANVSHELRTPLTLIIGPADQLINQQVENEQQRKDYLHAILRNSKKLLNIVNELLDLGKLEAGKLLAKFKPVELAPFVNGLYEDFSSVAAYKKISYQLESNINESLFVQIDQEKFEKISINLIGNAIKFTPYAGSITVAAAIDSHQFEFSVANTGNGIHPDDLPHVFDRYYQGERNEQPLSGGTGIGLAITHEFTVLMGGQITIKNTWGEGVVFKVSIPLNGSEQREKEIVTEVEEVQDLEQTNLDEKRVVLVVEDNRDMATYIAAILQPSYTILTAYNGVEALQILKSISPAPSLIISDVMMPDMDGFTLLETLKKDSVFCPIPVVMLSALTDTRNKLKALNIGVDDYITKPFLSAELIARVSNLIKNAALRFTVSIEEEEVLPYSPADLLWLSELENHVRAYNSGKTELNLAELSYTMSISERQLFRRIKAITGLTPNKYIRTIRLQIAREAIESGKFRTVAEIAYAAGFDTPAYFSKLFKEHYGTEVNKLL